MQNAVMVRIDRSFRDAASILTLPSAKTDSISVGRYRSDPWELCKKSKFSC